MQLTVGVGDCDREARNNIFLDIIFSIEIGKLLSKHDHRFFHEGGESCMQLKYSEHRLICEDKRIFSPQTAKPLE